MLLSKSSFTLEDVSQAPQQCEIEGRVGELHAWDYLPALQTVFESVGLYYLYHVNDFNKERFNAFMGQLSSTKLTVF
jgi:hypothetical protein